MTFRRFTGKDYFYRESLDQPEVDPDAKSDINSLTQETGDTVKFESMNSSLFCSGSYLESGPTSIVEFYCDDDLTIPSQWGFLSREEQGHFLDPDKTLFDAEEMFLSMSFINENDDKSLS